MVEADSGTYICVLEMLQVNCIACPKLSKHDDIILYHHHFKAATYRLNIYKRSIDNTLCANQQEKRSQFFFKLLFQHIVTIFVNPPPPQ